ncbi:S1 family peptidase [Flocculibacter collagenilyticus]|uniref:S1 family peptidase n=1 Tax=Flocculibacter collagenilyticus TaxID=2744479 RepID=UPI0018F2873E|nr:serine protease [Flocculibacter collagenilyticus]
MNIKKTVIYLFLSFFLIIACGFSAFTKAHSPLVDTVKHVKPAVVGIGIYDALAAPKTQLQGTGFAIHDGYHIVTNYHVIAKPLDELRVQNRVVFVGEGQHPKVVKAKVVARDPTHDLAILKIDQYVAPLKLANATRVPDGADIAFTGFPIGAVLGLYPATHRGIIAAYTPIATPSVNADKLSVEMIKRLKAPFSIYQLDATAYPGNSGSPIYLQDNAEVIGVINKVFIKETKENVLSAPSGITYAIPVKHVHELMKQVIKN